jgi:hypothetical protein
MLQHRALPLFLSAGDNVAEVFPRGSPLLRCLFRETILNLCSQPLSMLAWRISFGESSATVRSIELPD